MKITNKQLKQIIKEELESIQQEIMAPYGLNPYKYPHEGTVGEYRWKASIMTGSNTESELSMDLEVTDKKGKTVVQQFPRIFQYEATTKLGQLNKEPEKAKEIIDDAIDQGKPKESPRYSKDFR